MAGDTRDRIITATNELFRRHGYHGTSLSQVSEAAGATTGSIYHFFPGGKEALGVAVIETTGAVYRQLFEAIAAEASDPVAAFDDFFVGAAAVLEESGYLDPCPIGTLAGEVASSSEPLRLAAAAVFDSWIDAVLVLLQDAGVSGSEARDLALVFIASLEGGFMLSRAMRSTEPLLAAGRLLPSQVAARAAAPASSHR